MPQVRSNDVIIDYDDEGLGDPTLLLMPGWCGTRAAFDPVRGRSARGAACSHWTGAGTAPRASRRATSGKRTSCTTHLR